MYLTVKETRLPPLVFTLLAFISFVAILYSYDFPWAFTPFHHQQQFPTLNDPPPSIVELKHKKSEKRKETILPFAVGKTPEDCDIFSGRWVWNKEKQSMYEESECPYILPQLTCQEHGRPDKDYLFWHWQPHGCNLPKFNATLMLEALRGKRMLFVGDSLSRGQFISMVCLLHGMVPMNEKEAEIIEM